MTPMPPTISPMDESTTGGFDGEIDGPADEGCGCDVDDDGPGAPAALAGLALLGLLGLRRRR